MDPLGLVSVEHERTFRYAADLIDGRCSGLSKTTFASLDRVRTLKLTAAEVRAMRHQTRLTELADTSQVAVAEITTTINNIRPGTIFEAWGTYFGESERWGIGCDGKGYAEIFGQHTPSFGPPLPLSDPASWSKYYQAVHFDPDVVAARKAWAACFTAATGRTMNDDIISSWHFLESTETGPKARYSEEIWACFAETKLANVSHAAQQKWQRAHPKIVAQWQQDAKTYVKKISVAEAIIAREEAKTK